jgi:hypothetical protein
MHEPQEYFVYFKARAAPDRGERADALPEKYVKSLLNKKGSGANLFAPHHSSRFRIERSIAVGYPNFVRLGGQNLAALCAAASQNLAAVGGSHSLTETVDLGTMTIAGLVGTLHLDTPPINNSYARQSFDRSNTYY